MPSARPELPREQKVELAALTVDTSGAPSPRAASGQEPTSRGTRPWIVQFEGPVREVWKEAVAGAGGVLRGYLPNYAFLVEMDDAAAGRATALPGVRWVGEYRPDYKVQPFLRDLSARAASEPEVAEALETPVQLTVQTFAPEDASEVARFASAAGAEVTSVSPGRRRGVVRLRARLTEDLLGSLAMLGGVQWIEEYVPPQWHNDFAARGDHLNVTNVWATRGLTGRKQVVAHADTGLDTGSLTNLHPDFSGRVKAVYALGRPDNWGDPHGHGTHTAGSILGDGAASTGQFRGVAYEAFLVHQSVMDAGGGLGGLPADLYDLYLQAYTNGARIHSDSWGSAVFGAYTDDSQASDEFMWDHPDVLLVFSAGNEGFDSDANGVINPDSIGAPGTAKNMMTVGASENDRAPGSGGYSSYTYGQAWPADYTADPINSDFISESDDLVRQGLVAFSSRGPTDDGRIKPDLVAPGTDVISCRSQWPGAGTGWGAHPNPKYAFSGGTSMSTPLMAGAAALVRQYYMDRRNWPAPSAALVKATLLNGARSLTPGQYGTNEFREIPAPPRPSFAEGWGQGDIENTLFPAAPASVLFHDVLALATGGTNLYRLFLESNGTARLTLAWTDYPGTAGSGVKLVNNLDLLVLGPGGSSYYPNGRTAPDSVNNVEGVDVAAPVSGVYTVRVSGFNVPQGPQNFALVFNGPWRPVDHEAPPPTTNTTAPYSLEFTVTALNAPDEAGLTLFWNTNGTARFFTSTVARVSETLYRAQVPAQPSGTRVYYFFQGEVEGAARRHPTNAPDTVHSFLVMDPVSLQVAGSPVAYGTAVPAYGLHGFAPQAVVTATVDAFTAPVEFTRQACTGWTGSGSVPAEGATNGVVFTINTHSLLTWRWAGQFGLLQTSSVPGILNATSWWFHGASAQTLPAEEAVLLDATNHRFAGWRLDGARQPDASSRAVNPVAAIAMATSRVAEAVYLPENQDADLNGLPDWWELFYFGATGQDPGADTDGDTYLAEQEFSDGTDPTEGLDAPAPPVISHTPLADPQTSPAPWFVSATVTDNHAVASVTLWWRRDGGDWQSYPMVPTGATNEYYNTIPGAVTNLAAVAYYLAAADAAGFVTTGATFTFSVEYPLLRTSPTNLGTLWMFPASHTTLTVTVSNAGSSALAWTAQASTGGVGWLSVAPANGGLTPGSATGVTVMLNSAGYTAGVSRTAQVVFRGNDPLAPTSTVPVALRVGAAPLIAHTPPGNTTNTGSPYSLDATLTPTALVNTNAAFAFWSTNGGAGFEPAAFVRVTGDLFRAQVPAQPAPSTVLYYLRAAATNGLAAVLPTNAPSGLFSFDVTPAVSLVITGTPPAGVVEPPYGAMEVASGYVAQAYALADVPAGGGRFVCTGWLGSGNVPASGAGTAVTFVVREPSVLDWQWRREWSLAQTSLPAGILATTTWWAAGVTGQTVAAPASATWSSTQHMFTGWTIDGQRQPAATGRVINPVMGLVMTGAVQAAARYRAAAVDGDGDGLPDWWEEYFFGDTAQDEAGDYDGDGFRNGDEADDQTDPSDPASVPAPPAIDHTPLADPQTTPAPWPVSAVVTDNYTLDEVVLLWSVNGGGWNSAAMSPSGPANVYTSAIPAPAGVGDHVEYYLRASDPAGWTAYSATNAFDVEYPVLIVSPTHLEFNWVMPGGALERLVQLDNAGNAATAWRLEIRAAGLKDDVESGAGAWTHDGDGDLWRVSTNRSVSPDHAWYCGFSGAPGYANGMEARLVGGPVRIVRGARLRFQYWIQTELDAGDPPYAYDGGLVEISTNDGASYQPLEPVGGYPALARGLYGSPFAPGTPFFAGTGGWQAAEFDLSAYAGRTVRLAFRFGSDESFAEGEGWYLDDLSVTPATGTNAWWTADPTSGVLLAVSGDSASVQLDAAGLAAGDSRGAVLALVSDDPVNPEILLPLSMYVGPPVTLDHTPLQNATNTAGGYAVSVTAEPQGPLPEDGLLVELLWSAAGAFGPFETNLMTHTADNVWTGAIPAQPLGTRLYYFLHAGSGGAFAAHPVGAPAAVHTFEVTAPTELQVIGQPAAYGTPSPPYGMNTLAIGTRVAASAADVLAGGTWRTVTGWVGGGSVPVSGNTNAVEFILGTNSYIKWQWSTRFRLAQTSTPAGIIQDIRWLPYGAVTSTVTAVGEVSWSGSAHRFAEWRLNGARWPSADARAAHTVTGLVMLLPRNAAAIYLPASQDDDADGLPDWWERFEFGSLDAGTDGDPDGDGYSNFTEYKEETNPRDPASTPAPPFISHTPLADPQTNAAPWLVTAVVTDNFALASIPASGSALWFDGGDDYVMRNPVTRFPSNEITVEFWMRSSDRADNGTPVSYAVGGDFNDANEFTLYNYNTFLLYRGAVYTNTGVGATDGAWHHIALTWRATDGAARLFKDGVEAWAGDIAAGQDLRPGGALVFGQDQDSLGGGFTAGDAFNGLLDEVRLWSVVRTPEQIRDAMSNRLTGAEAGLAGYWRCDEGSGLVARDASGGGMDGTISGAAWSNSTAYAGPDVRLYWRRDAGPWAEESMGLGESNRFSGVIPGPASHGEVITYRLEAQDVAGLVATNGPHAFGVEHPAFTAAPSYSDYWIRPATSRVESLVVSNAGAGLLAWSAAVEPLGYAEDVESGTNGWSHEGGADAWHVTTARAWSGSHSWYQGDEAAATYANYMNASLVMPPLVLPPGAQLSFRHWADTELRNSSVAWDGGIVEISTNGGAVFFQVTPVGGYPFVINGGWGSPFSSGIGCFAGSGGWTDSVFDLSAYGGREVTIRFRFGSDQQNDYPPEGWFIDDVAVTPETGDSSWFSLAVTNGSLAGGQGAELSPIFDSTGLTVGDSRALLLRFESNDPNARTNRQIVLMTVSEPPLIQHAPLQNTLETNEPYAVEAIITSPIRLDTNALFLAWFTEGPSPSGATSLLVRVTNDLFAAAIPAQPASTRVHYVLTAAEGSGLVTRNPAEGEYVFAVSDTPAYLTVTGTPSLAGAVSPPYGAHAYASGAVVSATASPGEAVDGTRLACSGWTGSGSAPALGATNEVSFSLEEDSILDWQWSVQFALSQTSAPAGILLTTTWWFAGADAQTVPAPDRVVLDGTNLILAGWSLDGARWPDATNVTLNPAQGIPMHTARVAVAQYLREDLDADGDSLPDGWEQYHFGSLDPWRTDDPDGDGFTNLQEYQDRSHPRDPASIPVPPVIDHAPLADPQGLPAPWPVGATITDNVQVAGATLWWQRNGGAWQNAAMTSAPASAVYSADIAAPGMNGDVFAYRIEAVDAAGWHSTNGPHGFTVVVAALDVSPAGLTNVLVIENTSTGRVLQIANTGGGSLRWTGSVERVGFRDDMELGEGAWTHAGAGDLWHLSSRRAFSGTYSWYAGSEATGEYASGTDARLVCGPVPVRGPASLAFRYFIDSEVKNAAQAYDGGLVEISTNSGASYQRIDPAGGYPFVIVGGSGSPFTNGTPCLAGSGGGWQAAAFDLSAWSGLDVLIAFRFGSDSSKVSEGWYVDDVSVSPDTGTNTWLAMAPATGTVGAASSNNAALTFDAAGLTGGTVRAATLTIVSDAPGAPAGVPVSMIVMGWANDLDGDGMFDVWEWLHGFDPLDPADAGGDADTDGFSNGEEAVADTDPRSADSFLEVVRIEGGAARVLTFPASTQRLYTVSFSTNLTAAVWADLLTRGPATGDVMSVSDTNGGPYRVYRLGVERP
ncbi:MAG: S8 family serine peptidase [Acidobacteria bacterium]|nr:S8 family serine peptidase [Acidobacteriota bacterium]